MENRLPRLAASAPTTDDSELTSLAKQFEKLMHDKRLNNLQRGCSRSDSRAHSPAPPNTVPLSTPSAPNEPRHRLQKPSRTPRRDLPIYPERPQDPAVWKFCNHLISLSVTPTNYENPGLLDEALTVIPLDRIYSEADEESQILQAKAASLGRKPEWGYQDCIIRAVLK
jgi:peptide-N4-(N-acetyl-beta-glucosaminyl)asparagine amidase